jgi:hypothetical protein
MKVGSTFSKQDYQIAFQATKMDMIVGVYNTITCRWLTFLDGSLNLLFLWITSSVTKRSKTYKW